MKNRKLQLIDKTSCKWWRRWISTKPKKVNLNTMRKLFNSCQEPPQLVCTKKPLKGCNDGFYEVRIPTNTLLSDIRKDICGAFVVLRFIGLKYD